jgi:hypothetical protein
MLSILLLALTCACGGMASNQPLEGWGWAIVEADTPAAAEVFQRAGERLETATGIRVEVMVPKGRVSVHSTATQEELRRMCGEPEGGDLLGCASTRDRHIQLAADASPERIETVALHELIHVLGVLAHVDAPGHVMSSHMADPPLLSGADLDLICAHLPCTQYSPEVP